MMRIAAAAIALGTAAVLAMPAGAQGRPGGPGGFMRGGLFLLRMPEVQQELKMTQPQIEKLDTKGQELQGPIRDLFQNLRGASPEERQAAMAKIGDLQTKAVAEILDQTQMKRFKQLELQQLGAQAFSRKEIAAELKLTEEQHEKLRAVQQEAMTQQRSLRQGVDFQNMSQEERQQLMAKSQAIQKAASEKALAVLTDAQKKLWQDMQGAEFKFPAGGPPRRQP